MNFVRGEGEKAQLRMTKETTKTLAQGRKGRDGRPIVLDRQPAQVFAPGFPWSHAKSLENFSSYVSIRRITVALGKDTL